MTKIIILVLAFCFFFFQCDLSFEVSAILLAASYGLNVMWNLIGLPFFALTLGWIGSDSLLFIVVTVWGLCGWVIIPVWIVRAITYG